MYDNTQHKFAPIILFVYNRPWHIKQTVKALQHCELAAESDLYIFADGPKADTSEEVLQQITEVRHYIHSIDGFKNIHISESSTNKGLANSVINGVSKVMGKHGKVIVVEDDIVAHPYFLRFMNDALKCYEETKEIFAISATMEKFQVPANYKKDIFLTYRFGSWGWATWIDRWNTLNWDIQTYPIITQQAQSQIDNFNKGGADLWPMLQAQRNGEIDSWAIRMGYNMSLQNRLCLRPIKSFVNNIGMDGSGIHCGISNTQLLPLYNNDSYQIHLENPVWLDETITSSIDSYFAQPARHTRFQCIRIMAIAKRVIKKILSIFNNQ